MTTDTQTDIGHLLTIEQVAKLCCVSTQTITRWVRQRHIVQPIRIGRRLIRWRPDEVEKWIRDCQPARMYDDGT
jgi:excisionase family DNA binding protein